MDTNNPKHKITDWRIIGVSGDTADGREIKAEELQQMAQNYNPKVYGARLNLEHLRFLFPDWEGGYGDVVALKTEPWEQDNSKTALLAQIAVLPALQELWDSGQKIYTSMEIQHNFADTGAAYLVGLAVTDSPASLGTTANFSNAAQAAKIHRTHFSNYRDQTMPTPKTQNENQPTITEQPLTETSAENIFSKLFQKFFRQQNQTQTENKKDNNTVSDANEIEKLSQAQASAAHLIEKILSERAQDKAEFTKLKQDFEELSARLENTAASGTRSEHGGNNEINPVYW